MKTKTKSDDEVYEIIPSDPLFTFFLTVYIKTEIQSHISYRSKF